MYRVFIASPGGLPDEREAFRQEMLGYNEAEALQRGIFFYAVGWELTLGGVGRPQSLINLDVEQCDYLLLVLWDRWGSPPQDGVAGYTSGAEEEYSVAWRCFNDGSKPMRQILVFFKAPEERQLSDPGDQLKKVLEFKRSLEADKVVLFETFDDVDEFTQKLRRHLAQWVRDHEQGRTSKVTEPVPLPVPSRPIEAQIEGEMRIGSPAEEAARRDELTQEELSLAQGVVSGDVNALSRYGELLVESGRLGRARVVYERLLEFSKLSDNRVLSVRILMDLAEVHSRAHDDRRSAELLSQAVQLLEKEPGKFDREPTLALVRLGNAHKQLADYVAAEEFIRSAVMINRIGPIRPNYGLAFTLYYLSSLLYTQTKYRAAEDPAQEALSTRRATHGEESSLYAWSLLQVGSIQRALGDYAQAEGSLELSLKIHRDKKQEVHSDLAALGMLRKDQGNVQDAIRLLSEATALREKQYGTENLSVSYALAELADAYRMANQIADAESAYRRSFDIRRKILGEDHPATARAMLGLAKLYADQGGYKEALQFVERALPPIVRAVGQGVPMTARAQVIYSSVLDKIGRREEAIAYRALAVETFTREVGPGHPETIRAIEAEFGSSGGPG